MPILAARPVPDVGRWQIKGLAGAAVGSRRPNAQGVSRQPQSCAGRNDTCALTTRQPDSVRTQLWLWRPRRPESRLTNSVSAVEKSDPKVVMTVLASVRRRSVAGRA